jgi:hypothetical protein
MGRSTVIDVRSTDRAVGELLATIVTVDLPGADGLTPRADGRPPTADLIDEVLVQCQAARIDGLLARAVESGQIVVGADQRDVLLARHRAALRTCLRAEAAAVAAVRALRAEGIECRLLKGIAHAHLDEPTPDLRVFADADLLIRPDDLDRGLATLAALGLRRAVPPVRTRWERAFAKSIVVRDERVEIDLHLRLSAGYFGFRPEAVDLWAAAADSWMIAGTEVHAPDRAWRLRHAAVHAVASRGARWRAHRDVALLTLRDDTWRSIAQAPGAAVVAAAITETWRLLGLDPGHGAHAWALACRPSPADQRALAAATYRQEARAALPAMRAADRLRFIAGLAVPSRQYRRHRRAGGEL